MNWMEKTNLAHDQPALRSEIRVSTGEVAKLSTVEPLDVAVVASERTNENVSKTRSQMWNEMNN